MKRILLLTAIACAVLSSGCTGRSAPGTGTADTAPEAKTEQKSSGWYYFSDSGIHSAANPSDIPPRTFKPWTEAVRVADAAIISNAPSLLINRLGLLTAAPGSSAFALKSDSLFTSATAGGLYRTDYGAAVRMYRNSFFSDSASSGSGPCLALYDESKQSFAAGLNARDLGLGESAQCVALDRIGSVWYASFKNETGGKVDFTYLEFPSFPLRNPETGTYDLSGVRRISSDAYQRSVAPFGWKNAPDQLKELLIQIPDTTGLSIRVYSRSAKSTQVYVRASEAQAVEGTAFVSDDKTAALFADGTFYYKADNSSAKIGVLKLPQLATGYVYTWFVLTEKTLLAAWEEQRFFETGRTGLFETPLPGTPSVLPASR